MLAIRIIPVMLVRGRTLIKGQQFNSWRSVGVAMQAARIHAMRGVDELCILDIGATPEGRGPDLDLVRELSETCFTPLTVGGGVKSVEDVKALLRAGADKAVVGTAAAGLTGLTLISNCAHYFGSQAIVVALDCRDSKYWWHCGRQGGKEGVVKRAQDVERLGAGEILLTSIDREGTLQGYDLDLIYAVSKAVSIPVIANGGCGTYQHMLEAVQAGASAVAAGAMFQFTDATPAGAAHYLHEHGIEVRIPNEETA